jgi:hypothetical protein
LTPKRGRPSRLPALAAQTRVKAGAFTVAGQWRNFTAFPCILAIAVVDGRSFEQQERHETNFHVINGYKRAGAFRQNGQ